MRRLALVLCCLLLMSMLANAQPVEWTVWDMPTSESFPGDLVWMIDDSLFIALHDPQALARFEPGFNELIIWELDGAPGEFVWTNSGLLFTQPDIGRIGWLQPDANYTKYWPLPGPGQPLFATESGFGNGVENIWYLDWATGRLGLFEPSQLTLPDEASPAAQVVSVPRTASTVLPTVQTSLPEFHVPDPGLVPAVHLLEPVVSAGFREWTITSIDPPPYALLEGNDGSVWVPDNDTLQSLSPSDNTVTVYDLPLHLFVTGLSAVPDATDIYFLARGTDGISKIGVLQPENGSIAMWEIPGGTGIDAVSLVIAGNAIWFCDRGNSAIYRFIPMVGEFTWWETGGDDAPLYIEPGSPNEFWVSWERSGKLARLRLP
ncbi:hypothetical protein ACFLSW_06060 [Candidatus Bipolaricaulota bacterium]